MVLVLGADAGVVSSVLERVGDEDVVVLDESAGRLHALLVQIGDPRVWFMIGDAEVIPLPDGSADEVLGAAVSPEVSRVTR